MFGGGAKKEKKPEDEDRGDVSGSAKAQREAAAAETAEGKDVSEHATFPWVLDLEFSSQPKTVALCSPRTTPN